MQKIFLFGCGEMGGAILNSLLQKKIYDKKQIVIVSRDTKKEVRFPYKIDLTTKPQINDKDILIFAVPPQAASKWLQRLNLNSTNLLISIMAGYAISSMTKLQPNANIIRCIPNLLLKEQRGLTAYLLPVNLPAEHKQIFFKIFQQNSELLEVSSEEELDICTAVLGSGVGFVLYIIKAYFKAAKKIGLTEETAKKISLEIFENSSFLAKNSTHTIQKLVEQVCTKGGTTEAGILVFKKNNLDSIMQQCINESYQKSKKLFKG